MRRVHVVVIVFASIAATSAAQATGDAAMGKQKAALCTSCHGANGKATVPNTPNLAGQVPGYLALALKAYRDGKRTDPVMSAMAKPLSDEDIGDLAAHFGSL